MSHDEYLNIHSAEPLPSPQELQRKMPPSLKQKHFIHHARQAICRVLDGEDPRLLLILGPCSIHDLSSAKEYATRLRQLATSLSDVFLVVMRTYFEKPRTAMGWKGLLYDPWLDGTHDIHSGITLTRQLLLDLAEMEIPTAAELLDPASFYYFGDLITWGCIGARTASSQTHRQLSSALPIPIGFKNNTDGNLDVAINGILSAATPQTFIGLNNEGSLSTLSTKGNPHGHLVLRGGKMRPNYDARSITAGLQRLQEAKLPIRLVVDCSHDNSHRQHEEQIRVFQNVIEQIATGNNSIRGLLLESHLEAGSQSFNETPEEIVPTKSLTDPCIDWATTEQLLNEGYARLQDCLVSQWDGCASGSSR